MKYSMGIMFIIGVKQLNQIFKLIVQTKMNINEIFMNYEFIKSNRALNQVKLKSGTRFS